MRGWRELIDDAYTSWALFRHGACVVLDEPAAEAAARAAAILREYGPVQAGTDTADFDVVDHGARGRLVTCYHPAILVLVGPDEAAPGVDDLVVGLAGRARRAADAEEPVVRHEEAARRIRPHCGCLDAPGRQLSLRRVLGMDDHHAEAAVLACRVCGRRWLRYHYELEALTGSGRWYLGRISMAQALGLKAYGAKRALERLDWYFTGGSYFDGKIGRGSGLISL